MIILFLINWKVFGIFFNDSQCFLLKIFLKYLQPIIFDHIPEDFNLTLDPGNNEYTIMNHQICNPWTLLMNYRRWYEASWCFDYYFSIYFDDLFPWQKSAKVKYGIRSLLIPFISIKYQFNINYISVTKVYIYNIIPVVPEFSFNPWSVERRWSKWHDHKSTRFSDPPKMLLI